MDSGYGNDTELRTKLTPLGLRDVAGIRLNTSVWLSGIGAAAPGKASVGHPSCCDATSGISRFQ